MDIKSIFGASSDSNKIDKNNESRKIKPSDKPTPAAASSKSSYVRSSDDKAEISSSGRELLAMKNESAQYTNDVKEAESLSNTEINVIKEKVADNFYFKSEVIDKVVEKILALPNFR